MNPGINFTSKPFLRLKGIIIAIFIMSSCQQDSPDIDIRNIAIQLKSNQCRILEISKYVDDSWTSSIDKLGKYLPKSLPQQERKNILNLKNADLIRMFESYDDFDPKGHKLVDSMEMLDMQWADSLRNLSLENQQLELHLDSLLSIIDNPEKSDRLFEQVKKIRSRPCDDIQ